MKDMLLKKDFKCEKVSHIREHTILDTLRTGLSISHGCAVGFVEKPTAQIS